MIKQLRQTPAVQVNDPEFIRVKYSRFADDWLIGLSGSYRLAKQIKEELKDFLKTELKLTLSEEKTHLTPGRKSKAHYLGTTLAIGRGDEAKQACTTNGLGKFFKRRSTGWEVVIEAPIPDLIKRLAAKGFCSPLGEPTTKKAWIYLDDVLTKPIWSKRSELVERLLAQKCELCGATEQIEVDHLRKLANLKLKGRATPPEWVVKMVARKRKTLVVCQKCHNQIHAEQATKKPNTN